MGSAFRATALVLALADLLPGAAQTQVEGAPRIIDGTTIEIAGQRFRLHGIVAPALDQVCTRAGQSYPCGKVARAALWDLVAGLDVICTPVAATDAAPGGAAIPATCTAGGSSLNENMVYTGWALADRSVSEQLVAVEEGAKTAGRGLWSGEFELPGTPGRNPE